MSAIYADFVAVVYAQKLINEEEVKISIAKLLKSILLNLRVFYYYISNYCDEGFIPKFLNKSK
jgi:hypothetical protein